MYEAAQTNASAAGIWAIVAVAVVCLAFWLIAMAVASNHPGVSRPRTPGLPGPVLGGIHVSDGGRSVSPSRDSAATFDDSEADALAAGAPASRADVVGADAIGTDGAGAPAPPAPPTPDAAPVPTPRAADQPAGTPTDQSSPTAAQAMPGQRTGDADQPRRTPADGSRREER